MDISDGLALDLRRLGEASRIGAEVQAGNLPLHPALFLEGVRIKDPIRAALASGEEYELLLALRPGKLKAVLKACAREGLPLTVIGRALEAGRGLRLNRGGKLEGWPETGFQHRMAHED
jgi:thiamine-monophosphate kinase